MRIHSRITRIVGVALALTIGIVAERSAAADVYLNGVKVVPAQLLNTAALARCSVKFDAQGNVWITSPSRTLPEAQGNVESMALAVNAPAPLAVKLAAATVVPPGGKHFYLWWEQSTPGLNRAQYDFDIFVNGQLVQQIAATDRPGYVDLTGWVTGGLNRLRIQANKNIVPERVSSSETDTMTVTLGQGAIVGKEVVISETLVEMRRSALETDAFLTEATFAGR